jgi:hypothetical protein
VYAMREEWNKEEESTPLEPSIHSSWCRTLAQVAMSP